MAEAEEPNIPEPNSTEDRDQISNAEVLIDVCSKARRRMYVRKEAICRSSLDHNQISRACVTELGWETESSEIVIRWRVVGFESQKSLFRIVAVVDGPHQILIGDSDYEQHIRKSRTMSGPSFSARKKTKRTWFLTRNGCNSESDLFCRE